MDELPLNFICDPLSIIVVFIMIPSILLKAPLSLLFLTKELVIVLNSEEFELCQKSNVYPSDVLL